MIPECLKPGDRVAILSPASIIRPEYVAGAVTALQQAGYEPIVMPHTLGHHGSFSGSVEERLGDFLSALREPAIRAIICSRGGYGCVHLLEAIDKELTMQQQKSAISSSCVFAPKWLVGFSDVSALHSLWGKHGIASVHGSMAKQLAKGSEDAINQRLFAILEGNRPALKWEAHPYNMPGSATGITSGGNMAVTMGLFGTKFSQLLPGGILVIEDIGEPIYKVERMLYNLHLSGILPRMAGMVIGQFTNYEPSADWQSMEDMINHFIVTHGYTFPVAFGAPIGHVDANEPWLIHAPARLEVTDHSATLVNIL